MSDQQGDKSEAPTPRRLEESIKRGEIPRSQEIQTVFVLLGGLGGMSLAGDHIWNALKFTVSVSLGHLHATPVTASALQGYAISGAIKLAECVWPVLLCTMLGGLLAGALQTRFNTAPDALGLKWERLNPMTGLKRVFSFKSAVPASLAFLKLLFIGLLTWSTLRAVLGHPIFTQCVTVDGLAEFLGSSSLRITGRVALLLGVLAAADYGWQYWSWYRGLMMTKEEVKEEAKNSEGNPHIKSGRRRLMSQSTRKMLAAVPKADVLITNPTHIAVALRYDRKKMRAPQIVAKGIRLNAQNIREIARAHGVPIVENKPLARLMFKYGKVGGEIPAQLYAAVAEVLAWVYANNRYRYYAEANQR